METAKTAALLAAVAWDGYTPAPEGFDKQAF